MGLKNKIKAKSNCWTCLFYNKITKVKYTVPTISLWQKKQNHKHTPISATFDFNTVLCAYI